MRNISFALTTEQIQQQTKTVTRRLGWRTLLPGTLLQPVKKCMGLKPGERIEKIAGPIRVTRVSIGALSQMVTDCGEPWGEDEREAEREGFPNMTNQQFVEMFCQHMKCTPSDWVTRIEFEYTEPKAAQP